jgi:hypothetical protein
LDLQFSTTTTKNRLGGEGGGSPILFFFSPQISPETLNFFNNFRRSLNRNFWVFILLAQNGPWTYLGKVKKRQRSIFFVFLFYYQNVIYNNNGKAAIF